MHQPSAFITTFITLAAVSLGISASDVRAQQAAAPHAQATPPSSDTTTKPFRGDPYLLDTDPVSKAPLGPIDSQVILQHEGRELRFTGSETQEAFKKDPNKYLPAVDALLIQQQLPFYPLKTCVVSGKPLGSEGTHPVDFIYRNRLVRLSGDDSKATFLKQPDKYIADLDKAVIAAQRSGYTSDVCFVSGDKLGADMGTPVDLVYGNRLVRFCCKDCIDTFRKDPLPYLAKLDASTHARTPEQHAGEGPEHGHGDHGSDPHDHGGRS